ncbi:MAG: phosphocholine cytidylyltransferase family protein [Nitrospina sp.]|nr:MAG: phosphocholine cytidylyltransferase family protein [Nitrospina sp.]
MNNSHFNGNPITTALLLAAGKGHRLQPLTDSMPKCLIEINGITILERLIDNLCDNGFKRLVIVVGYLDHCIRRFVNEYGGDLTIEFVTNPLFQTTNNIYSLWLARKKIRESFLLVESDLVFESSQLEGLLNPDRIAISYRQPWMNGTTVTMDSLNRVTAFGMGSNGFVEDTSYKTVNIYSLSNASWRRVVERLELYISSGKVNEYYEVVFKEMIADGSLSMEGVFFDPEFWYEIDTPTDLVNAERILGETDTRSEVC